MWAVESEKCEIFHTKWMSDVSSKKQDGNEKPKKENKLPLKTRTHRFSFDMLKSQEFIWNTISWMDVVWPMMNLSIQQQRVNMALAQWIPKPWVLQCGFLLVSHLNVYKHTTPISAPVAVRTAAVLSQLPSVSRLLPESRKVMGKTAWRSSSSMKRSRVPKDGFWFKKIPLDQTVAGQNNCWQSISTKYIRWRAYRDQSTCHILPWQILPFPKGVLDIKVWHNLCPNMKTIARHQVHTFSWSMVAAVSSNLRGFMFWKIQPGAK